MIITKVLRLGLSAAVFMSLMLVIACASSDPRMNQPMTVNILNVPAPATGPAEQIADIYAVRSGSFIEEDPEQAKKDVDSTGKPWADKWLIMMQWRKDVTDGHSNPASGKFALIKISESDFDGKSCKAINSVWLGVKVQKLAPWSQALNVKPTHDIRPQAVGLSCGSIQVGRVVPDPTYTEDPAPPPQTDPNATPPPQVVQLRVWNNGSWHNEPPYQGWDKKQAYMAIYPGPGMMEMADAKGKTVPVIHWVILSDQSHILWPVPAYMLGQLNDLPMGMEPDLKSLMDTVDTVDPTVDPKSLK